MVEPLVVLLIVVASDASDPTFPAVSAFREAVSDASRGEARVVVDARATLPSDPEAPALANGTHARVVTEMRWRHDDPEQVTLHIHVGRSPAWIDRAITFRRNDAPSERGRAIGVVVAALLPAIDREEAPPAEPIEPTPSDADRARSTEPTPAAEIRASPPARRSVASIGVSGAGYVGLGGPAPAIGAAIDARWQMAPRLGIRIAGAARFGSVDAAQGTARTFTVGAGASVTVAGDDRSLFALAIRSDVLASALQVDRRAAFTGVGDRQARWLPAVDAAAEGFWNVSPNVAVSLSVGGEATLGSTAVIVDGRSAASMAFFSAFTEAGLRFRF